ncbi:hypothetical protein Ancab_014783 [Ancistrocladus abbreviatus]
MEQESKTGSCSLLFQYRIGIVTDLYLNKREQQTTLTEEAAIAAPAIHGGKRQPVNGKSIPAATGIPRTL